MVKAIDPDNHMIVKSEKAALMTTIIRLEMATMFTPFLVKSKGPTRQFF